MWTICSDSLIICSDSLQLFPIQLKAGSHRGRSLLTRRLQLLRGAEKSAATSKTAIPGRDITWMAGSA